MIFFNFIIKLLAFNYDIDFLHILQMATNQKTLHKNAKQKHAHVHLSVSGSLKSKNLFNTRLTVFPVNMILVKGDKDGVNPSSFDEDDEDTEDDDNDDEYEDEGAGGNFAAIDEEEDEEEDGEEAGAAGGAVAEGGAGGASADD